MDTCPHCGHKDVGLIMGPEHEYCCYCEENGHITCCDECNREEPCYESPRKPYHALLCRHCMLSCMHGSRKDKSGYVCTGCGAKDVELHYDDGDSKTTCEKCSPGKWLDDLDLILQNALLLIDNHGISVGTKHGIVPLQTIKEGIETAKAALKYNRHNTLPREAVD